MARIIPYYCLRIRLVRLILIGILYNKALYPKSLNPINPEPHEAY